MLFDFFYFENDNFIQPLKQSHPRYVLALDDVNEILEKLILHPPFSLTQDDFKNQKLVKLLLQAEVIKEKNSFLGLAVPVFIEKDLNTLKSLSKKIALQIVSCLLEHQSQLFRIVDKLDHQFTYQRHLYHLLCGKIFDGKMFEFLEDNRLVTTSKILSSGIDCLVIIYEKSPILEAYSSKLLCSYNRYTKNGRGFVSFGDCDGNRKDFYRYYKQNQLNQLNEKQKQYMRYNLCELIEQFELLVHGKKIDASYQEIFEYFEYVENGKMIIPVYEKRTDQIVENLYEFVWNLVGTTLKNALSEINSYNDLLAIQHEVDEKDIANEIYHLIFGEVNEQLVRLGIVEEPPYIEGEGRYLKCYER